MELRCGERGEGAERVRREGGEGVRGDRNRWKRSRWRAKGDGVAERRWGGLRVGPRSGDGAGYAWSPGAMGRSGL